MPRAWQELRKQLFLISSVLLLFAVHVRKKEEGLPLGDPIVMGLSPGRRAWGWPPENRGDICQMAPGIQEDRREMLPQAV